MDSTPRQAQEDFWVAWSDKVNKLLGKVQRDLLELRKKQSANIATINKNFELILGPPHDEPRGPDDEEPVMFTVIKELAGDVAHQMLRDQKCLRDSGIWNAETTYGPGAAVTFDGAVWACQSECRAVKPGDGVMWRLMHKTADVQMLKQIRSVVRDEVRRQMTEKGR